MKRFVYLDVLRGIAILLMVIDHSYDWWLDAAGHATRLAETTRFLGTLAAPLFLYLVGIGLVLSVVKSGRIGSRRRSDVVRHLAARGAKLVVWGYALNLLIFFHGSNTADLWAVDILQIIGVTIWLSIPFLWAPSWMIIAATLLLSVLGQTAGSWTLPDPVAAYITGNGGIGYFPLAVWLPYTFLGLIVGRAIGNRDQLEPLFRVMAIAGLLSMVGILFVDPGWGYRHPRPVFVLSSLTVLFGLTAGLWLWIERLDKSGPLVAALRDMGLASLMLYILHHLIGYRLFWLVGLVDGRSWQSKYGIFGPIGATLLFACLLILMVLAARLWPRLRTWPSAALIQREKNRG